jgi:hypothetical protein
MKSLSLLLAVALLSTVSLRADLAHDLSEKAVPQEKKSLTNGYAYAVDLYQIFTRNGIEAYLVQFQWTRYANMGYMGSFVVFRDADGKYWGQESTSIHARWVAGTTPKEWAASFYSNAFTEVKSVGDNRSVVGIYRPGTTTTTTTTMAYSHRMSDTKDF